MNQLSNFFWPVVRILPMNFTPDLTDYEFLLKVYQKLQEVIDAGNQNAQAIEALKNDVNIIQQELENIKNGGDSYIVQIIQKALGMLFVGISQNGQLVIYRPRTWEQLNFATTGYDIVVPTHPEYGRIVILY